MRKQDYVSIEVAKLLQEKGFREPCKGTYLMEIKDEFTLNVNSSRETEFKDLSRIPSEGIQLQYLAPTVYEARDWIAKKCNTILLPDATWEYVDPDDMTNTEEVIRYSFMIFGEMHSEESYETMEEALNAGILYVLKDEDLWLRMELYCSEVKD